MNARTNIEDNIFILNIRIRMIHNLLLLDADPDLFLEKTLEDADFISHTLDALLGQLAVSTRYIDRKEQFHNLAETENAFSGILTALQNGNGAISESVPENCRAAGRTHDRFPGTNEGNRPVFHTIR